ncbi:MAG: hypothetical protein ACE5IR_25365 [bacterium]
MFVMRDAANTLAQRNGTNAQEFRLYNTDSGADDEFLSIGGINNANVYTFESEATGTGTIRPFAFMGASLGIGETAPATLVQLTGASTPTLYIESTTASDGGRFILEDTDGAGCSQATVLNGVVTWATVTCP